MDNESNSTQDTPNVEDTQEQKTVLAQDIDAKADESQTETQKTGSEQEANNEKETKVPTEYKLNLPEGSSLKQDAVDKIVEYARENQLSEEQAQKLLERESQTVADIYSSQQEELKAKTAQWFNEIKSDQEFGGEHFNQNAEMAKRFINKFGDDDLKTTLEETGLGNHPGLFKMVARAAKAMSEDQLLQPGERSRKDIPLAQKLYGGTTN